MQNIWNVTTYFSVCGTLLFLNLGQPNNLFLCMSEYWLLKLTVIFCFQHWYHLIIINIDTILVFNWGNSGDISLQGTSSGISVSVSISHRYAHLGVLLAFATTKHCLARSLGRWNYCLVDIQAIDVFVSSVMRYRVMH